MDTANGPKMTMQTVSVLRALLQDPTRELYGVEICAEAGLPSGTIHPILARLERIGWVESRWENISPQQEQRPRRRYYRLSLDGATLATRAVNKFEARTARLREMRPGWVGGIS